MNRHCPVCESSLCRPFAVRDGFSIVACRECGVRYLDPQPTVAELDALYGEQYFAHGETGDPGYDRYVDEIDNIRRTFDDRLCHLPAPKPGDRLLDLGAAIGVFVERARRAGWEAEGLDPSAWACRYAADVLGQPVRQGTIETAAPAHDQYDAVTMWEVIEHLPDPRGTLRAVGATLKPGGLLALSTPDAGSRVARLLGGRWPGWTKVPEHLTFFDRQTLGRLLREAGFHVETQRYVPLVVSRGYFLDRVGRVFGTRIHRRLPERWLGRPVRVNPFYDLLVVARRS